MVVQNVTIVKAQTIWAALLMDQKSTSKVQVFNINYVMFLNCLFLP